MHLAPDASGLFTGDYQGLAARGSTFVSLYCATKQHFQNRTDCYVSQVRTPAEGDVRAAARGGGRRRTAANPASDVAVRPG